MQQSLFASETDLLIYIPSYNCAETIVGVIDDIPGDLWQRSEVLVVDNQSSDNTVQRILDGNKSARWPKPVKLVQPKINQGYAGSQKLAYKLMLENPNFQWVMMLHGDGQYDSRLIPAFVAQFQGPTEVVYGYRSWTKFWSKDETPFFAYLTIKGLSLLESVMTGYRRYEWHSGMVAYKRSFLARVNFENITKTMHMDGHLLFAAGRLKAVVRGIPIYKRYKNFVSLTPSARVRYVFNVLALIPRMHFIPIEKSVSTSKTALPQFEVKTLERAQPMNRFSPEASI